LYPWLDREQIPPGRSFQDEIQKALPAVRSMTVFLGPAGVGPWEAWELRVMISQCVETGKPVIPVLLPGVSGFPPNLLFLKEMTGVAFREHVEEAEPLAHLVWGITGVRPPG
jgi:hypothetical protein